MLDDVSETVIGKLMGLNVAQAKLRTLQQEGSFPTSSKLEETIITKTIKTYH